MNKISKALLYLSFLSPCALLADAEGTYLENLNPVVYLDFDVAPSDSVTLNSGRVLQKATNYQGDFPGLVSGPNTWVDSAWDFSQCDGPYELEVDAEMATVGNISLTDGLSVSFWTQGTYSGVTSRIMAGPFDIGTKSNGGFYAGTKDYKTAHTPHNFNTWDGNWHHIVMTADFTGSEESVRIYQDGVQVGSRDGLYLNNVNFGVGYDWYFGARNYTVPGFDYGSLAGIAVFDRVLTAHEIGNILAGPVYAGLDQTLSITEPLALDGVVPSGSTPNWSVTSGPSGLTFTDVTDPDTAFQVTTAGDYVLTLTAAGLSSDVSLTIAPNEAPVVITGDGIVLSTSSPTIALSGTVEDTSIPVGGSLTSTWSVISMPTGGAVTFVNPNDLNTNATFTLPGIYRLQLSGTDGELTTSAELSILVEDANATESYVRLLRPTVLLSFDRPALSVSSAQLDATGSTGYLIRFAENGLPQIDEGARSYTGYSWDFGQTDSDVEIINGEHLRAFHEKAHPARSLSYWYRADGSADEGYLSTIFGLQSYRGGWLRSHEYSGQFTSLQKSMPAGNWHHIVVVFESSNNELVRELYVDGVLESQATDPYPSTWWEWGNSTINYPIYVGSRGRSGELDSYTGQLDDFALFDYALSAADVSYLYNGPSSADVSLLTVQDNLSIDAGVNQYIEVPSSHVVSLAGSAVSATGLTPSWRLVEGDGTVSFSDSSSLTPSATFTPITDDEDGAYSRFILELSLVSSTGKVLISDEMTVLFYPDRSPEPRVLSATPAAGEHPRIFFTMADLPELRTKAATVPLVTRALQAMQADVDGLELSTNQYGAFYQQLKNGEDVSVETVYGINGAGGIFKVMAEAAYISLLGTGGVSDTAKLTELATVFTAAVRDVATWYEPNYVNALGHDINWAVGLSYDLLHNWMDEAGRADARALISRMTSHRNSSGSDLSIRLNSTNWAGFHDHILPTALAIEGEEGYDVGVMDAISRSNAEFLTQYGVFESGFPHEGYGYYTFGMTWHSVADYTIARRANRENFYKTTRFYKSIEAAFRLMDPNGTAIRSHHDTVEGATGSGEINFLTRHILIAKHMWPDDPMVDYVYAKLLDEFLNTQDVNFDVFHAIFGEAVDFPTQSVSDAGATLEANVFCPDRGFVAARNEWADDGLRFQFRCRTDKYWLGHQHADVNTFELWSHGKEWIIDRGKFGGTNSDVVSTVFIDGTGACSADDYRWPSLPGQFVEYSESDTETIAVGDAKLFYSYSKGAPATDPESFRVMDHGLMWSDFYTPRDGYTMPDWMSITPYDLNGYGNQDGVYTMLPVEHAYRTTILTKGESPYVIVVDDIQKDQALHDYTWITNTVIDGLVEVESQSTDQLVLRYVGEETSGARLLIQVLEATGQSGSIYFDESPVMQGVEAFDVARIKIESTQVLKPNFKVLLYPFEVGDTLPTVEWNGNTASVTIDDDVREFTFSANADGRTRVSTEIPPTEAPATTLQWDDGASDSLWTSDLNWNQDFAPRSIDGVWINTVDDYVLIDNSVLASGKDVVIARHPNITGVITEVTGGSLTVSGVLFVGQYPGSNGLLRVSGGNVTTSSELGIAVAGTGSLEMSGGLLDVATVFKIGRYNVDTAIGRVDLDGGTISCASFAINDYSELDIEGGTLIIDGNRVTAINNYIGNLQIKAYGGTGNLHVDYDVTHVGKTTITATPPLPPYVGNWDDGAPDSLWVSDLNWVSDVAPRLIDDIWMNTIDSYSLIQAGDIALGKGIVIARHPGRTGIVVELTGGSLTAASILFVGQYEGSSGKIILSDGAISTGTELAIATSGAGELEMTGGTIDVTTAFKIGRYEKVEAVGHVDLHGGTITCGYFTINSYSSMDMESGVLIIDGNRVSTINGYVSDGRITAYGGTGTISVDYDVTNAGKTTVTATNP